MALTKVRGDGAEGLTLSSTSLTIANGLTLTDGDVTFADGHGLNFASTGDGSGTDSSELLHDYEEGTWTPAYTFSGGGTVTHGTRGGNYVKVGDLVQVGFNIRSTAVSSISGNLILTGLPYAVKNATGSRMGGSVGFKRDWGADMPNFTIYTNPGASTLAFYYNAFNAGTDEVGTGEFSTGSDNNVIEASVVYITG